jgi:hypothetical protein
MGPTCQTLWTINLSFLGVILTPNFWLFCLFFGSRAALETLRMLLPHGSRMSSSQNDKCFFSSIFLPTDFWFIFSFDPLPPLKLWRRCWLMGPDVSLPVQETCDILIILQTIKSVFRSELLQTDKLNLYFYINELIWISLFLFCFCEA